MKIVLITCLGSFLVVLVTAGVRDNLLQEKIPTCGEVVQGATSRRVRVVSPPDLRGKWVSSRCETRPGPIYVTRSYDFLKNGNFKLLLHIYEDQHCTRPALSYNARGKLMVGRGSWITPGGTQAEYLLNKMTVTPHTTDEVQVLDEALNLACPNGTFSKPVKLHRPLLVYVYSDITNEVTQSYECSPSLEVVWHELQLIRQEDIRHRTRPGGKTVLKRYLYLGDLHTQTSKQKEYRPTAYQLPLISEGTMHSCPVCEIVARSSERSPPHLQATPELPLLLQGSWASPKCEVQRYGMFLTRRITFSDVGNTWQLQQKYYKDAMCRYATYTLDATGSYIMARPPSSSYTTYIHNDILATQAVLKENNLPNELYHLTKARKFGKKRFKELDTNYISDNIINIADDDDDNDDSTLNIIPSMDYSSFSHNLDISYQEENYGYDLTIEELSVTPNDYSVVNQLNNGQGGKCGRPGKWRLQEQQDVTKTGGCAPMGITVPTLEREIMKNEVTEDGHLELYLGQTPTLPYRGEDGNAPRPTSWAPPLVQCTLMSEDQESNELLPMMGARVALGEAAVTTPNIVLLLSITGHIAYLIMS